MTCLWRLFLGRNWVGFKPAIMRDYEEILLFHWFEENIGVTMARSDSLVLA